MLSLPHPRRLAAGVAVAGLLSGCATSAAVPPAPSAGAAAAAGTAKTPLAAIDRLTATAKRRYGTETHGGVAFGTLHRVGRDAVLLKALQSRNLTAARAYVTRMFRPVWYHWHVSRLRIVQGSKVVIDAGVPFVVAPVQMTLKSSTGRSLGRLQVSIQDEIGFVRFMHRNYPVDVVVRGHGAAHVRSSLPAAANAKLPSRGSVRISGRTYQVRSFHETALGAEPVTVWILAKG
jgi:hypothetical protein